LEQTWPLAHLLPQEPQLPGSVFGSTQLPPQDVRLPGHALASHGASVIASLVASDVVSVVASRVTSGLPSKTTSSLDASPAEGMGPGSDNVHALVVAIAPRTSAKLTTDAVRRDCSTMTDLPPDARGARR
jgi:hypothetical protein